MSSVPVAVRHVHWPKESQKLDIYINEEGMYELLHSNQQSKAKERCQNTITRLRTRYVDHARDPSRYNIIIIVRKHTRPANDKYHDLPYYVARIQQWKKYIKLRWFDWHFPEHEVIVEINPNRIHAFTRFEEEEHAEQKYMGHIGSSGLTNEKQKANKTSGSSHGKKTVTRAGKKVKKTWQPKEKPKSPKLDGPKKAPKSPGFVDTDSSTEDEQGPTVKHPKKAPKSPEFVDTDPSTSLLLPAVKNPQKTIKTPDEDPQ